MTTTNEKPEVQRCAAIVYVAEQLRRTGRGKYGFERHYERRQCSRKAVCAGYCKQHAYKDRP